LNHQYPPTNGKHPSDKILILDFGAQYAQLIARCVREIGVYCELHPFDIGDRFISNFQPCGIILSGGPRSATDSDSPRISPAVFQLGVPVLGICYGMQAMAVALGGAVETGAIQEYGHALVQLQARSRLLNGIHDRVNTTDASGFTRDILHVWMSHGDKVRTLPPGFTIIATNDATPVAAMADESRNFYGVQFHPEVTHTSQGKAILRRFVVDICSAKANWNMPDHIAEAIDSIRTTVNTEGVLLGLSGGVDSAVAATLIHRAIGDQLTCIFVDTGLLRLNEAEQVIGTFAEHLHMKVVHVNAADHFFQQLAGITDPEAKRKIIGREFVTVFQHEAEKLPNIKWLAQGTIYPDVIESAAARTKKAHSIKSHHNVGGLPETLHLKLLEPLRELFKDEVRKLGLALGLPPAIVNRHPFPGPGLGVRILGEVTAEYADILRRADAIFIEELVNARDNDGKSWYEKTAQAFAVFLPVRSVGVMGDGRTYEHVLALRAVQSDDFMTAHWAELPHALLAKVSARIINEVRGINRVVYDISSKPPATIEWE
jgi:GMP synthase (glutamine-hydrolysing)